jgi:hypothetical protein
MILLLESVGPGLIELIAAGIRYAPGGAVESNKNNRCAGTNIFPAQHSVKR